MKSANFPVIDRDPSGFRLGVRRELDLDNDRDPRGSSLSRLRRHLDDRPSRNG